MLAESVYSVISSVQIYFHRDHLRGPTEAEPAGDFHCGEVAHKGFVAVVGEQAPLLVAGHVKETGFFVEFDFVRLFRHPPGGIAAAAYAHSGAEFFSFPEFVVRVLDYYLSGFVFFLAVNVLPVVCGQIDLGDFAFEPVVVELIDEDIPVADIDSQVPALGIGDLEWDGLRIKQFFIFRNLCRYSSDQPEALRVHSADFRT